MLVNVTFPSLSDSLFNAFPNLVHFATGLHVFVSSSDLFSVRFAAVVVHSSITLVLYLLYERKCALSTPIFARIKGATTQFTQSMREEI